MKKLSLLFFAFLLAMVSCTEPIELDLNSDENVRLVVDAVLTTEVKQHYVHLTLTSNYFTSSEPAVATGAVVTIFDGTTTEVLAEEESGKYRTSDSYQGVVGTTYTLTIDYEGETYKSVQTLPPGAPMDNIYYDDDVSEWFDEDDEDDIEELEDLEEGQSWYLLYGNMQEPEREGDYYVFRLKINGEYDTKDIGDWFFTDDTFVNGNYIGDTDFFSFKARENDVIELEQYSTTQDVYDYILALLLETDFRGSLFDGAPANVPPNIDNGALGVFIVSDVHTLETVIEL